MLDTEHKARAVRRETKRLDISRERHHSSESTRVLHHLNGQVRCKPFPDPAHINPHTGSHQIDCPGERIKVDLLEINQRAEGH